MERIRADEYKLVRASAIKPKDLEWLLKPFIPLGMLTVVTGDTGIGKSTFLIDVIARLTSGRPMPVFDDEPVQEPPLRGSALILNKEDSPEHIVVPRLRAARADVKKVSFVSKHSRYRNSPEPIDALDDGVRELEKKIKEEGDVKIIFIDPITSFVGKKGITQDNKVRDLMNPLADLAKRYNIAIVYVLHMNKTAGQKPTDRFKGSGAFTAIARSKLWVLSGEKNSQTRLLAANNTFVARQEFGVEFEMKSVGQKKFPQVEWGSDLEDVNIRQHLAEKATRVRPREAAVGILHDLLSEGPVRATKVMNAAKEAKISRGTMNAAKGILKIEPYREKDAWWWALPKPRSQEAKKPRSSGVAARKKIKRIRVAFDPPRKKPSARIRA